MNDSWHRLFEATAAFRRSPITNQGGVATFPSPYQIPEGFRQLEDSSGDLYVEFRYIDEGEPSRKISMTDGVVAIVGKSSGRIFGIRIPRKTIDAAVSRHIEKQQLGAEAIDELRKSPEVDVSRIHRFESNFKITRRLFCENALQFTRSPF